jgi:hypothetical protein
VLARRGFNSPSSGGKEMRRASRIIILVDSQCSGSDGEKHRSRMGVPAAKTAGLKRRELRGACRAHRGATVRVLVTAVVEAFVSAKLERPDISTALFAAAEPQGTAAVRRLSKRVHRALTAALAEATGATFGDMEFVTLMLYSAMTAAVRVVLEAGASPVRLREELLVLCQAYAARSRG